MSKKVYNALALGKWLPGHSRNRLLQGVRKFSDAPPAPAGHFQCSFRTTTPYDLCWITHYKSATSRSQPQGTVYFIVLIYRGRLSYRLSTRIVGGIFRVKPSIMASMTETERETLPLKGSSFEVEKLLSGLAATHTKPLWAQMTRLNPPLPNPTTVPYVWKYDEIRPQLLQAGELITEKQAERRVLMLVNPAKGTILSFPITRSVLLLRLREAHDHVRCTIYYRHPLRRSAIGDAKRDSTSTQAQCICNALHH